MIRNAMAAALAAAFVAAPAFAHEAEIAVDCGAGDDLQSILWGLDAAGPHILRISGTCEGNFTIYQRDHVALWGNEGAVLKAKNPNQAVLFINSVNNIEVYGLKITGGRAGINVTASDVYIGSHPEDGRGVVIEGNRRPGLTANLRSLVVIESTIIRNNRSGIASDASMVLVDGGLTIENNQRVGIAASGSALYLFDGWGPNVIRNNGGTGVSVADSSRANILGANTIEGNAGAGLFVFHMSMSVLDGLRVLNNGDLGVSVQETAHAEVFNIEVRNNGLANPEAPGFNISDKGEVYWDGNVVVEGNKGPGLVVTTGALLSDLGGNSVSNNGGNGVDVTRMSMIHYFNPTAFDPNGKPTAVTGNGGSSLTCDSTSLLAGAVPSVPKTNCSRIERDNGRKPRGGRLNHLTE